MFKVLLFVHYVQRYKYLKSVTSLCNILYRLCSSNNMTYHVLHPYKIIQNIILHTLLTWLDSRCEATLLWIKWKQAFSHRKKVQYCFVNFVLGVFFTHEKMVIMLRQCCCGCSLGTGTIIIGIVETVSISVHIFVNTLRISIKRFLYIHDP